MDDQTISFKGTHVDKLRTNNKKEGDGFQRDTLFAYGYMFSVYFRNIASTNQLLDKGIRPYHARVVSLFEQFPSQHYMCGMDNMYESSKLSLYAINCKSKLYIHCVKRKSSRIIPTFIKETSKTIKDDIMRYRGTLKVEKLAGDPTMKDMVAKSFYYVKPFYFLKNAWIDIRWIQKHREVWRSSLQWMINM